MLSILGTPLGYVMWALYQLVPNYAVALLLFTLITRLILLPLAIKQQKSMAKMAVFQPKMQELQKKYANNKEKLQEEMMKLYSEEGYNPMSGCLPLVIQLPILMGLIDVIYKPLKHILHMSDEVINAAVQIATDMGVTNSYAPQLAVMRAFGQDSQAFESLGSDFVNALSNFDLNFLGIFNLADTPTLGFNVMVILPIVSGLSALLMSLISMRQSAATNPNAAGNGATKTMMLIMPLMSLAIAFSVPAGVVLYWIYSNLIAIVQSLLLYKFYNPQKMAEKIRVEMEEKKEKQRQEKIEAKKQLRENPKETTVDPETALSEKEKRRQKLAAARRRDAEKYGEEYKEVTDEDLK
jgi:YidC/Oxa1 family membrane protein insertase